MQGYCVGSVIHSGVTTAGVCTGRATHCDAVCQQEKRSNLYVLHVYSHIGAPTALSSDIGLGRINVSLVTFCRCLMCRVGVGFLQERQLSSLMGKRTSHVTRNGPGWHGTWDCLVGDLTFRRQRMIIIVGQSATSANHLHLRPIPNQYQIVNITTAFVNRHLLCTGNVGTVM